MSLPVLAIVLVFVVLALGAFFLAMSGGPKGARRSAGRARGARASRPRRRRSCSRWSCSASRSRWPSSRSDKDRDEFPAENIRQLSALQLHGQELFGQQCRRCHTLAASNAVATVGPNLDQLRPPKALVLDAIEKGRARGNGQMAADLVEGEDAEAVAQYVAVAVGQDPQPAARSRRLGRGVGRRPDASSDESGPLPKLEPR